MDTRGLQPDLLGAAVEFALRYPTETERWFAIDVARGRGSVGARPPEGFRARGRDAFARPPRLRRAGDSSRPLARTAWAGRHGGVGERLLVAWLGCTVPDLRDRELALLLRAGVHDPQKIFDLAIPNLGGRLRKALDDTQINRAACPPGGTRYFLLRNARRVPKTIGDAETKPEAIAERFGKKHWAKARRELLLSLLMECADRNDMRTAVAHGMSAFLAAVLQCPAPAGAARPKRKRDGQRELRWLRERMGDCLATRWRQAAAGGGAPLWVRIKQDCPRPGLSVALVSTVDPTGLDVFRLVAFRGSTIEDAVGAAQALGMLTGSEADGLVAVAEEAGCWGKGLTPDRPAPGDLARQGEALLQRAAARLNSRCLPGESDRVRASVPGTAQHHLDALVFLRAWDDAMAMEERARQCFEPLLAHIVNTAGKRRRRRARKPADKPDGGGAAPSPEA